MKTNKQKNRSNGWSHAKESGHRNEFLVSTYLNNKGYKTKVIGTKKVDSILGKKTPTKPDVLVVCDGQLKKRSLKKSLSGQVHMNKVNIFIKGYESIYGVISEDIKEALRLVFSGSNNIDNILNNPMYEHQDVKIMETQKRRKTVCFDTLKKYNITMFDNMIQWFKDNITNITTIVFKTGWVKDDEFYANEVWYKNMVDDKQTVDEVFDIEEMIVRVGNHKDKVYAKTKNGGTVINLPFGWVQYHQGGLQFHHSYGQIKELYID